MKWRVIITDSESMTGVAPVCEQPLRGMKHGEGPEGAWVYDCCPKPHIETYSEDAATKLAALLTEADAEPCT